MSETKDAKTDRTSEWMKYWDDGSMAELHAKNPHPKILEHFDRLVNGKTNAKIFFPLCGDVVDMIMCVDKGHSIVGVECSEMGVKTFFKDNNIDCTDQACEQVNGKLYQSKDGKYRIYCCDLFDFNQSIEGKFDAILDFGSMGAVNKSDQKTYAELMKSLMKPDCRHLLECFLYDLEKYPNSLPSCFTLEHLQEFYGDKCNVEKIEEGPNPYEESEAQYTEKHSDSAKEGKKEGDCDKHEHEEDFPPITGAAYFMISPKTS